MNDDVKDEVQAVLVLLRDTLVRNGVSMYLDPKNNRIGFFDTNTYMTRKEFKGFHVDVNTLVR